MIGSVVGRRITRAKCVTERFAREVREAEQWVKAEPALIGRRGVLFGLGESHHQRRVKVEDHRFINVDVDLRPDLLAHVSEGPREVLALCGVELVKGAIDRRVRGHVTEEFALCAQVLHVGAALAAAREHEGHLHEHLASIVTQCSFARRFNA